MKRTLQAFSLGLFVAGLIMVTTSLFSNNTVTSSQKVENLDVEEMIDIMKENGYRVVSESEYISLSLADSEQDNDSVQKEEEQTSDDKSEDESSKDKDDEDKQDKEKVTKYTLNIKDGMPSSDIGDLLEENEIIDDGSKFNKYLEDEGYSEGIQLGKFKVKSDMSFAEIAKTFTR